MRTILRILFSLSIALALPSLVEAQVDINHADAKTLAQSLIGVGLVKAEAIVAYRDEHGPFSRAEDLGKVKGIGAKTINANRDAIVIVNASSEATQESIPRARL